MAIKDFSQVNQPKREQSKGFATDSTQPQPAEPRDGVRSEVTAGLANVLTDQAQRTAGHIQVAEQFGDQAAKALAHRAHALTSGQRFTQSFVAELNRLTAEQPYDGFPEFDWTEAETLLRDLGKPSLPPVRPNFLPPAA